MVIPGRSRSDTALWSTCGERNGIRTSSGTRTLSSYGQPLRNTPCAPCMSPCTEVNTTTVRSPGTALTKRPIARSVASMCA
jgi:hypothetical protein